MNGLVCVTLRQRPELKQRAAAWFHAKWGVPEAAYLACMEAYLRAETEYGWYLCLDGERIVGGLGVIENDFHDRKDLAPNICAVYTEPAYRRQGVAGSLLNQAVADLKARGIMPVYLFTDHTGFYERYGWEFFCLAQGDGEERPSRMYIHKKKIPPVDACLRAAVCFGRLIIFPASAGNPCRCALRWGRRAFGFRFPR